ncbi:MAG TPA: S-adenosylmethionine:tRNA ribosyltransferase-isomerase [Candidatus Sulfomarinibacteraceae bacterium]|nr:S-adenosylmethionine:tRNA ribosyltransferase-isomerase [Candidatus Sulfomarinibacteraceae bacterium]
MMLAVANGQEQMRMAPFEITSPLDFDLPRELEAGEPAEARGLARDDVRLMVSYRSHERVIHTRFSEIDTVLRAGDVLVLNTSGTRPAALPATDPRGRSLRLHLSTQLPAGLWLVELRRPDRAASQPYFEAEVDDTLSLPDGGRATLHRPHGARRRLWVASVTLPEAVDVYLGRHGQPIRYSYVRETWPIDYYQTVYAMEPGSAEMPSAGRAFTPELLTRMVARGVQVVPLILHTGVASLEAGEAPYEEYYRVPASTARAINAARSTGRIIAVGTTVVRALETVVDSTGRVHPGEGWTNLLIEPRRQIRAVEGLLTGLHEPRASHLDMLQALAGAEHVRRTYQQALQEGYLWHEFGDLHLILP